MFHTSNYQVVDWLSKFTEWHPYNHKVKALLSNGQLVIIPVNKETANIVGVENILDIFYRPYTKKMWGLDLEEVDPKILARVKIRDDLNEDYFPNDTFQGLPSLGYTEMFNRILDHKKISIYLNNKFSSGFERGFDFVFNSMSIDEYFNYEYGKLEYRSNKFHNYALPIPKIFPVATVNYTHDKKFTRVTEWKNLPYHINNSTYTCLTIEEPCDYLENDEQRFYPVKDTLGRNKELYKLYSTLTAPTMTFIGRYGLYVYIDMDQAVNSALSAAFRFRSAYT